jgi:protease-4
MTQRALRQAMQDDAVQSILLAIDSPGGHVAGTDALAQDVARMRGQKPIVAQIDDFAASAAYWIASQTEAIYANNTAEIGSIGTVLVVEDSSGRMDRLGIKVHVISTGPFKGLGADGAPLTDQHLAYLQERVDGINQHFLQAVRTSRRLSPERMALVADGRVHLAGQAMALGLIDGIQSLETTLAQLASPGAPREEKRRGRATRLATAAAVCLSSLKEGR